MNDFEKIWEIFNDFEDKFLNDIYQHKLESHLKECTLIDIEKLISIKLASLSIIKHSKPKNTDEGKKSLNKQQLLQKFEQNSTKQQMENISDSKNIKKDLKKDFKWENSQDKIEFFEQLQKQQQYNKNLKEQNQIEEDERILKNISQSKPQEFIDDFFGLISKDKLSLENLPNFKYIELLAEKLLIQYFQTQDILLLPKLNELYSSLLQTQQELGLQKVSPNCFIGCYIVKFQDQINFEQNFKEFLDSYELFTDLLGLPQSQFLFFTFSQLVNMQSKAKLHILGQIKIIFNYYKKQFINENDFKNNNANFTFPMTLFKIENKKHQEFAFTIQIISLIIELSEIIKQNTAEQNLSQRQHLAEIIINFWHLIKAMYTKRKFKNIFLGYINSFWSENEINLTRSLFLYIAIKFCNKVRNNSSSFFNFNPVTNIQLKFILQLQVNEINFIEGNQEFKFFIDQHLDISNCFSLEEKQIDKQIIQNLMKTTFQQEKKIIMQQNIVSEKEIDPAFISKYEINLQKNFKRHQIDEAKYLFLFCEYEKCLITLIQIFNLNLYQKISLIDKLPEIFNRQELLQIICICLININRPVECLICLQYIEQNTIGNYMYTLSKIEKRIEKKYLELITDMFLLEKLMEKYYYQGDDTAIEMLIDRIQEPSSYQFLNEKKQSKVLTINKIIYFKLLLEFLIEFKSNMS